MTTQAGVSISADNHNMDHRKMYLFDSELILGSIRHVS